MAGASSAFKMEFKSRKTAPGHPVKFWLHRSFCEVGPYYRNVAEWQIDKSKTLYRKNLIAHFGCVNAIEFSKDGRMLASGGDDRRVLLWDVDKVIAGRQEPRVMQAEHLSNVFSLDFSCSMEKIISAGNDDQVILHDVATGAPLDYFVHEQPVYGVSADPVNDPVFCSACDDGRILIFDIRDSGNDPFCLAKVHSSFHSVMYQPLEPRLVVTANSKEGVASWDVRMPKRVLIKYGMQNTNQCCMSARFNRTGSQILVLRRRLPPILYSTDSPYHLFQFNHRGYYNSCTMKSCSFAGLDDQYVLSGSDNFDLHLWKIPPPGSDQWVNKADMVLRGHRSIVNQVRYNYVHNVIASSGVEKIVKLWSPFPLPEDSGGKTPAVLTSDSERQIYTPDDYVSLVMQTGQGPGQFMSLTYESGRRTTREDSRMLAFFDALVQRDINGLSDDDSDNFPETSYTNTVYSTPASSSSDNEDEDSNPPNYRSLLTSGTSNGDNRFSGRIISSPSRSSADESSNRNGSTPSQDQATTNESPAVSASSNQEEGIAEEDPAVDVVNAIPHRERADSPDDDVDEDDDLYANEPNEQTEDRDMTANMITQLILEKEDNRRKYLQRSTNQLVGSNGVSSSTNKQNESEESSAEETKLEGSNSSSRPLCLATRSCRPGGTTSSNYSQSRSHFRKQLLNARRRELQSATPVYDSSRNNTSSTPSSFTEMSLERINEYFNQPANESDSSVDSSSSSSSESSSSEIEENEKTDQSMMKGTKKITRTSVKTYRSRAVLSTDSSSSSECESKENEVIRKRESECDSSINNNEPSTSTVHPNKDLKRKRRPRCKLNEACKVYYKNLLSSESDSRNEIDETTCATPNKKVRLEEESDNHRRSVSPESTTREQVIFKRSTKHKDRIYRKATDSIKGGCTPPDSGIDVSKEPEPCCSKSFNDKDSALKKKVKCLQLKKNITTPTNDDSSSSSCMKEKADDSSLDLVDNEKVNCESKTEEPLDDPGFGQVESDTDSN